MIIGGAAVVIALALVIWWVYGIVTNKDVKAERKVQVVQVIRPAPPPPEDKPPPPPPPEQKPEEQLPQDEPEPAPSDAPAPAESLGLDADGSAGGDAFGLAARKGGRDLTGSGGAIFAWYTSRLKDSVVDRLSSEQRLRGKRFSITVKVWIERDGKVREVKLATSSGNREIDAALESTLSKLPRMSEGPPLEMPQPISLKIVSST